MVKISRRFELVIPVNCHQDKTTINVIVAKRASNRIEINSMPIKIQSSRKSFVQKTPSKDVYLRWQYLIPSSGMRLI
ncbi:hypothetical protein Tco_0961672, partial [Tanacetum coccineum]